MKTTWEKIVNHAGTLYGQEIGNELHNRTAITIPKPQYSQAILDKHREEEARRIVHHDRVMKAKNIKAKQLTKLATDGDGDAAIALAELENEIDEAVYKISTPLPIILTGEAKADYDAEWRMYRETAMKLKTQRGQAFHLIRGQCMQVLIDKMKHDPD